MLAPGAQQRAPDTPSPEAFKRQEALAEGRVSVVAACLYIREHISGTQAISYYLELAAVNSGPCAVFVNVSVVVITRLVLVTSHTGSADTLLEEPPPPAALRKPATRRGAPRRQFQLEHSQCGTSGFGGRAGLAKDCLCNGLEDCGQVQGPTVAFLDSPPGSLQQESPSPGARKTETKTEKRRQLPRDLPPVPAPDRNRLPRCCSAAVLRMGPEGSRLGTQWQPCSCRVRRQ
ncbi:hypothetical protein CB1_000568057 [Camelus ferus]|nr:hypothetical protein CB1_000568057 [Camelus ferus]